MHPSVWTPKRAIGHIFEVVFFLFHNGTETKWQKTDIQNQTFLSLSTKAFRWPPLLIEWLWSIHILQKFCQCIDRQRNMKAILAVRSPSPADQLVVLELGQMCPQSEFTTHQKLVTARGVQLMKWQSCASHTKLQALQPTCLIRNYRKSSWPQLGSKERSEKKWDV